MKTLSGLDASFLYLETPETPMHVGSLHLYELPKGFRGSFHKRVQQHVAARLHGQLMDRTRPLWEFHVFENLIAPPGCTGRVVGFYAKIHHAALDGKAGTLLANTLLDLSPAPRPVPPVDAARLKRRQVGDPGTGEKVASLLSSSLAQYVKLVKALPGAARAVAAALGERVFGSTNGGAGWRHPQPPLSLAPKTCFNAAITAQRQLATVSLPFAECRAIGHPVGASFNDVVLWLCATALREYLQRHARLPRKPLVAAMPVSLREPGNEELNTQASLMLVQLGTHLADPLRRMKAIAASTAKVKEALTQYKSLLPTHYPSLLAPWIVGGAAKAAYKVYSATGLDKHLPMLANVVISNVPGPQVPLYLAGARMLTYHPMSIVMHGMALNITVQTYAGHVDFGLVADAPSVPHLQDLADALQSAFAQAQQLRQGAVAPAPMPARQRPARRGMAALPQTAP